MLRRTFFDHLQSRPGKDTLSVDSGDVEKMLGDALTLSGTRTLADEAQRDKYVRVERTYGPFQRSFTIGVPLQNDRVTANYQDGVLEIHLPKAEETRPKRVEVKVSSG